MTATAKHRSRNGVVTPAARTWLLGAVAGLSVAAALVAQLLYPPGAMDLFTALIFTLAVASMAGVGAFLAIRVPANRVGWLLLIAGSMLAAGVLCGAYTLGSIAAGGTWSLTAYTAWLTDVLWVPPIVVVAAGVPLAFPDGNLPSPRWRPIAWLLVVGTIMSILAPAFTPGPINETITLENPFGIPALAPYLPIADTVSMVTALPAFVGAWAAVVMRFRRGSSIERHQVKWLLTVALVGVIAFPVAIAGQLLMPESILSTVAWVVGFVALIGLPLTIGVAILRYRLYEIDRLVSRTIGWAIVTGMLVTVFVVLVVTLQAVLAPVTNENTLAVAASTLVAFALFQPLRRRVQHAVDRRFDRARYDGQKTVDAFGERLRGQVNLAEIQADLSTTITAALSPASSAVWLRGVTTQRTRGAGAETTVATGNDLPLASPTP